MKRWPAKPLEEIAEVFGGSTPSRDNTAFWNGEIPWVTPTDLPMPDEGISIVSHTKDRITQAGLDNSSVKIVPKGTVLFSSRATIGKVAVAKMPLTTNQGFANFVPRSEVSSRFLAYSLWHRREDIARLSGSTTFKEVSRSTFRKYQIPVPPLAEQDRIVKLLDEADELRKLRAQADRRTAALIPALFHEMFGDPALNPLRWKEVVLGDVIHAAKDGPHVSPIYAETGVPFLSTRHVKQGQVVWEDLKFLSREEAEIHWNKCKPERGDVLYTKGGTTGIAAAITFDTPIAVWVHVALLKTDHAKVDPVWLENMLNSSFCYQQSQQFTHGITNRDLGLTRMVRIGIYLPPLPLQRDFAHRVTEIRALEAAQAASRQRLEALFQSMLHRAFNGEL
jgi:type I restriction enzyme, S subunit